MQLVSRTQPGRPVSERDALTIGRGPTRISLSSMTQHGLAAVERCRETSQHGSERLDIGLSGSELNDSELYDLERRPRARLHAVDRS
jgi:hypothetical protein